MITRSKNFFDIYLNEKSPTENVGLLTFTPVIAFAFYANSDYYRINRIFPNA